jgi:DnaJ family protein C protein 7
LAKLDLNKALQINPKNTKNLKRLANIHILTGNLGEAEILFQKCINFEPKDSTHTADLTKAQNLLKNYEKLKEAFSKQDFKKTEELAEKMLTECTEWSEVKLMYVEALLNNVKLSEAINFLASKLNHEESTRDEFQYLLCLAFYYDGHYEKAKKILSSLLNKCNDNHKFNHLFKVLRDIEKQKDKANETFKAGKYEEAIEQYTALLEIDPNNNNFNSTIIANRALCLQKLGKNMEALKDINRSIQLNERYWKAYMRRGNIYMVLKMYEEAKYDFQKVKDNDPSNKDIHKLLEDSKKEESKAKKRDYYKILEINKDASADEIRKAYKKLALKWHPDRNCESEESQQMAEKAFRDINDAYSVLSDTKKKQQYDMGMDPLNPEEGSMFIFNFRWYGWRRNALWR